MRIFVVVSTVLFLPLFVPTSARADDASKPAKSCESLKTLDLSTTVDKPTHIESVSTTNFKDAEVCEVRGYIEPAVKFVASLPVANWDGRFLQVGCGGLCGHLPDEFSQTYGSAALQSGRMATAGTDMGHEGPGPEFGDNPQLRTDFAYRGVHVREIRGRSDDRRAHPDHRRSRTAPKPIHPARAGVEAAARTPKAGPAGPAAPQNRRRRSRPGPPLVVPTFGSRFVRSQQLGLANPAQSAKFG